MISKFVLALAFLVGAHAAHASDCTKNLMQIKRADHRFTPILTIELKGEDVLATDNFRRTWTLEPAAGEDLSSLVTPLTKKIIDGFVDSAVSFEHLNLYAGNAPDSSLQFGFNAKGEFRYELQIERDEPTLQFLTELGIKPALLTPEVIIVRTQDRDTMHSILEFRVRQIFQSIKTSQ